MKSILGFTCFFFFYKTMEFTCFNILEFHIIFLKKNHMCEMFSRLIADIK